jgi:FRG domain
VARPPRWEMNPIADGTMVVDLSSWKWFHDFISQKMLDFSHYIWRGQRDADWVLESTLDRRLGNLPVAARRRDAASHLARFQESARGRRGPNPPKLDSDDEWWALGQHHGLATPLLDWTESAFVALYFAFERAQRPPSGLRSVWAVGAFEKKNSEIQKASSGTVPALTLDTVRPHGDENARLVAQAGLFTKAPIGTTVDGWIRENFKGHTSGAPLLKLTFPELGRTECLRTLNKMNINHLSLFPDLYGSGAHCNKSLEISRY